MSQLCGSDILAYDYCGYGFSTGRPSEENCYESIEARGGPGGGKDGGIIELDIWPVTWGYTHTHIYIYICVCVSIYVYVYIYILVFNRIGFKYPGCYFNGKVLKWFLDSSVHIFG